MPLPDFRRPQHGDVRTTGDITTNKCIGSIVTTEFSEFMAVPFTGLAIYAKKGKLKIPLCFLL